MNLNNIGAVYFIGVGGIGMSALARYFRSKGLSVAGYDRTASDLTAQLSLEKIDIHYDDAIALIPLSHRNPEDVLVVYTPAVPDTHEELNWFRNNGFTVMKRAKVLGEITRNTLAICIAGTHGKTTISSMIAHLLQQSPIGCNAFLGGILKNYDSNLLLSPDSDFTVVEADEFDRSFHQLTPYMAVISSIDPDHLDIYETPDSYHKSFEIFGSLVRKKGILLLHKSLELNPRLQPSVRVFTYSKDVGDFHAENIWIENGSIIFDFVIARKNIRLKDISLGVPVEINIENAVAAIALAWLNGVSLKQIRHAMATFQGARRRFDIRLKRDNIVVIDDYAHHPVELCASIRSVKQLYKGRRLTGVFQPHLYSRTRDFAADFAASLSLLDELILLDIYPAREQPIPGVTSSIIFDSVSISKKTLCHKEDLPALLASGHHEVVLMAGAGDIEQWVEPVCCALDKPNKR